MTAVLPGATIGILGGGQLGRMTAQAAQAMGYRVAVFDPDPQAPAAQVTRLCTTADYDDLDAVAAFARQADVVTFEFENVPAATAEACAAHALVRPAAGVLHVSQQRLREKQTLAALGLPVPAFRPVDSLAALRAALAEVGLPAVLKTVASGYDGKGQQRIDRVEDAPAAWAAIAGQPAVLEAFVSYERELSVIGARSPDGRVALYAPFGNDHADHILDVTVSPAPLPDRVCRQAHELARAALEGLGVVGLLCVELFLLPSGSLLINETAPRPHNSGHVTLDAHATSQFEQHVRAVCGLPLGPTTQLVPGAALANLLGDLWQHGEPNWPAALAAGDVHLHLYGKAEPRPRRKMGHLTATAADAATAEARVRAARAALTATRQPAMAADGS